MIIVFIILTILAVVVGIFTYDDYENASYISICGAFFLGVIDLFIAVAIIYYYLNGCVASEKIKMYKEENKNIETQIDTLVKEYMEYEGKTLKEFKSDSSITLVSIYPNLKSDELVKQQIKAYTENNKKIKELEEVKIELKIGKWLLYFGG